MDPPPVQYVTTPDGFSIAYALSGAGPPLVQLSAPFSHVQLSWEHPTHQPLLEALAARFRLVQYDSRGQGMSTRGLSLDSISIEHLYLDLESVIGKLDLEAFVLLCPGHTGHVGILYAVRHPDKVKALVLLHCGLSANFYPAALFETLPFENWDVFLHNLLPRDIPSAERGAALLRLRETFTQADFQTYMSAIVHHESRTQLSLLTTPTLVIHVRDFPYLPVEESMKLASQIDGARYILIPGETMYGNGTAVADAIQGFVASLPGNRQGAAATAVAGLSPREIDVLRLLAGGRSNLQIADELVISQNTVIRHVSNIFAKTGVANRAQAAMYARDHGIA